MPRAVAFLCLACACLVTAVTTAGAADGTPSNLYLFRTFFTRGKLFQALWNKAQDELPSPDTRAFVLFDNSTNNATLMDAAFHAAYADRIISVTQAEGRAINGLQKGMKFSVDSTLVLMWRRLRERLSLDRSGVASTPVGVDATLPPLAHVDYVWVIESGVCAPGAYGADVSGSDGVMCVVTCCEDRWGCRLHWMFFVLDRFVWRQTCTSMGTWATLWRRQTPCPSTFWRPKWSPGEVVALEWTPWWWLL